jgi:hypothetical protein
MSPFKEPARFGFYFILHSRHLLNLEKRWTISKSDEKCPLHYKELI